MKLADLYQAVTNRIVADLERGEVIPWLRPWKTSKATAGSIMPHNALTGRNYSGVNILILWGTQQERGYPTAEWLTFKQAQEAGAHVRKGERASTVVFVKRIRDEEEDKLIPMMKLYSVFNRAQIDGLVDAQPAIPKEPDALHDGVAAFISATRADIRHGGDMAAYSSSKDIIVMPPRSAFRSVADYENTALHELAHWTAHPTRLNRDLKNRFATRAYAAEELIAELSAAFLCAHLGIEGDLRHAGYVASWIDLMRDDNRAIFTAASKASQAADYLRAFSEQVPDELAEAA